VSLAVFILLQLIFLKSRDIFKILSLSFWAAFLTLIILVPSIIGGNVKNSLFMIFKVLLTVGMVNIFSFTTGWHSAVKTFKLFYVPDIFIFIMDICIRYIYLLGDLSLEMMYALKSRTIGRNKGKYKSMSGILGSLFLKSMEMGNEMYYAMECRGFNGEYKASVNKRFTFCDLVYIIAFVLLAFAFFFFGGV
jgi:cobalt/nickel transport system permease protein